jgi:hypothetical protein
VRIYLNTSALSRPFDDLSRSRARNEAEAVSMLVAAVEARHVELVASEYLAFELRLEKRICSLRRTTGC